MTSKLPLNLPAKSSVLGAILVCLALAAIVWAVLLPSSRIAIRPRNTGSKPIIVVIVSSDAKIARAERLEPGATAVVVMFKGEMPGAAWHWPVGVTVLDEEGRVIESRIGELKEFAKGFLDLPSRASTTEPPTSPEKSPP